jgi:hypothetical protein
MGNVLARCLTEALQHPRGVKSALAVLHSLCPEGSATSRFLAGCPHGCAGRVLINLSYLVRQPAEHYTTDGDVHSTANVQADASSATQAAKLYDKVGTFHNFDTRHV